MRELYEKIRQTEDQMDRKVLTVLEGAYFGEKVLVAGDQILWSSRQAGFFSELGQSLYHIKENGKILLDGTAVFCDSLGKERKIVICGGGHVAVPLIQIANILGFQVSVLEDRPLFANNARKAGASQVFCEAFEKGLDLLQGDQDTYFVIVTRGHRYDQVCLEKILKKQHAYIGMIGSRRRVRMVKENLRGKGCDPEILEQVYTPIGLNIGAETPAEIAVAIMAEIIEVKNRKQRTWGYSKELINEILNGTTNEGEKVLATIVAKKGSAPQGVGAKMLISRTGSCVGTIGGGCLEAEVIRKALLMMEKQQERIRLSSIDLTGNEAEEDGMVCGGTMEVMLEVLK